MRNSVLTASVQGGEAVAEDCIQLYIVLTGKSTVSGALTENRCRWLEAKVEAETGSASVSEGRPRWLRQS